MEPSRALVSPREVFSVMGMWIGRASRASREAARRGAKIGRGREDDA